MQPGKRTVHDPAPIAPAPDICWAITDAAAGNQRQALALAARLGLPVRHLVVQARAPWAWLAPRLTLGGRLALPTAARAAFAPPWPRVAIGCGRSAALFTRMLRPWSDGRCRTVQILDPRIDPTHWDAVIAPRHDGLHGPNVWRTLGSLNPIDEDWLTAGRLAFPELTALPRPRIGVLIGGPRRGIDLDAAAIAALLDRLRHRQQQEGGSLLVLTSRRTPPDWRARLRGQVAQLPGLYWDDANDQPNPYPGVLGWADALVVSPDSVNMLSEACAVGCAVHTFANDRLPPRLARFHAALREAGRLQDLRQTIPAVGQPPLRETAQAAAWLLDRLAPSPTHGLGQ